jgi:hypothetical protein
MLANARGIATITFHAIHSPIFSPSSTFSMVSRSRSRSFVRERSRTPASYDSRSRSPRRSPSRRSASPRERTRDRDGDVSMSRSRSRSRSPPARITKVSIFILLRYGYVRLFAWLPLRWQTRTSRSHVYELQTANFWMPDCC